MSYPSLALAHTPQTTQSAALRQVLVKLLQSDTVTTLSLHDPWGSALAVGAKSVETRSWPAPERYWEQAIAIHVSGTLTAQAKAVCEEEPFSRVLQSAGYSWTPRQGFGWNLPLKHVIAIAWLERVQRITSTCLVDEHERIFGNYTPGRYAWKFGAVYRLKQPIEATGRLGLWQWTPPVAFWDEIQEQLDALPQGGPQA
jgi:activating signal cointegrator 1